MNTTRRGVPGLMAAAVILLFISGWIDAQMPPAGVAVSEPTTAVVVAAATSEPATPAVAGLPVAVCTYGDRRFAATTVEDFRSADFSPDGTRLITAGDQCRVWNFHKGAVVNVIDHGTESCDHAVYLDNDTVVVAWHAGKVIELDVHDVATGRMLRKLDCDEDVRLSDLVASPDGTRVVAVGRRMSLIDTQSGKLVAELGPQAAAVNGGITPVLGPLPSARVRFSNDSAQLMAIGPDSKAAFYDGHSGLALDLRPFEMANGAATSGDGKLIAVAGGDTRLFDVVTREEIPLPAPSVTATTLPVGVTEASRICCMMYGNTTLVAATTAPEAKIFLWETTVRPITRPKAFMCRHVHPAVLVFSRDEKYLAILSSGTRPEVIDVKAGTMACEPSTHMSGISAIAVSPDGKYVVTGDTHGTLARWDFATGKILAFRDGAGPVGIAAAPGALLYTPDGKSVLVGSQTDVVDQCDAVNLKLILRRALRTPIGAVRPARPQLTPTDTAFSPDGSEILSWYDRSSFRIYDRLTGKSVASINMPNTLPTLGTFSPDGKSVAIPTALGLDLYVANTGGKISKRMNGLHVTTVSRPRFAPDGKLVYLVDHEAITCWDAGPVTADTSDQPEYSTPINGTGEGDIDTAGSLLAVGTFASTADGQPEYRRGTLTLIDAQTGKPAAMPFDVTGVVSAVKFLPHKPSVIVAGSDGTATLWDLRPMFADPSLATVDENTLWETAKEADPIPGFKAVFEIARRGQLIERSKLLSPLLGSNVEQYRYWIGQLSAADDKEREAAHKHLEAAGPAAIGEVQRALAAHPGGEAEDRLAAIAQLLGQLPPAAKKSADPDTARVRRVMQALDWADTADARAEMDRLGGRVVR